MRFTTRDLLWLTVVLALLASRVETEVAVARAKYEKDMRWNDLAFRAGVHAKINREEWRRLLSGED